MRLLRRLGWTGSDSPAPRLPPSGIVIAHDALHPSEPLHVREALAAYGVDADHVKIQQAVAKLRRRHGLVMSGEPREPGYRVEDWTWEARRVRSSVRGG